MSSTSQMRAVALLHCLGACLATDLRPERPDWNIPEETGECGAEVGDGECDALSLLQRRSQRTAAAASRDIADDRGEDQTKGEALSKWNNYGGSGYNQGSGGSGYNKGKGGSGYNQGYAAQSASPPGGDNPQPTPTELQTLAAVIGRLWTIEAPYRLKEGTDYKLNSQAAAASVESGRDTSSSALFTYVNPSRLSQLPCTTNFLALLDNYNRDSKKAEVTTAQEVSEQDTFIKCVMATPHMKYVYNVLVAWKTIKPDYAAFSRQVSTIWLTHYSTKSSGPKVSSGFEHTFVGEEKYDSRLHKDVITGLHNWLQFWNEEKARRINYLGYVGKVPRSGDALVSARFVWDDDDPEHEVKSISTFLVGTSPAFEFAMLTCAFLGFNGEAKVSGIWFGNSGPARITTYSWKASEGLLVRTGYLEA